MRKEYYIESKSDKIILLNHKNQFDTPLNNFIRRHKEEWAKEIDEDIVDMYGEIRFKIQQAKFREPKVENFLLSTLDLDILGPGYPNFTIFLTKLLENFSIRWDSRLKKYFEVTSEYLYDKTKEDKENFLEILLFDILPYKIEAYWIYEKINQPENKRRNFQHICNKNFYIFILDMIKKITRNLDSIGMKTIEKDLAILLHLIYEKKLGIRGSVYGIPFFALFNSKKYSSGDHVKMYIDQLESTSMDELELIDQLKDLPVDCGIDISNIEEIFDNRIISQKETNNTVVFGDNFLSKGSLSPREFIRESSKLTKNEIKSYLQNHDSHISFILSEDDLSFLSYEYRIQKCLVKNPEETKTFIRINIGDKSNIFLLFKLPEEAYDKIYGISLFPGKNHKSREVFSIVKNKNADYKVRTGKAML